MMTAAEKDAEKAEKRRKMYNAPSTREHQAQDQRRERDLKGAPGQLANRHRDELAAMGDRHRSESLALQWRHGGEHNQYVEKGHAFPAKMADKHKEAVSSLRERHGREREKMTDRHRAEKATVRSKK
jgi:hypothetical protein